MRKALVVVSHDGGADHAGILGGLRLGEGGVAVEVGGRRSRRVGVVGHDGNVGEREVRARLPAQDDGAIRDVGVLAGLVDLDGLVVLGCAVEVGKFELALQPRKEISHGGRSGIVSDRRGAVHVAAHGGRDADLVTIFQTHGVAVLIDHIGKQGGGASRHQEGSGAGGRVEGRGHAESALDIGIGSGTVAGDAELVDRPGRTDHQLAILHAGAAAGAQEGRNFAS